METNRLTFKRTLAGIFLIFVFLMMGFGFLLNVWGLVKHVPNAVITEGTVIYKYYDPSRRLPGRHIMIYSYENPYWAEEPQRPVIFNRGVITAKNGRPGRQQVGRNFYKQTEIDDKIVIKYRPSKDIEQSSIKGGLPLGSIIFNIFSILFCFGLTYFFSRFAFSTKFRLRSTYIIKNVEKN